MKKLEVVKTYLDATDKGFKEVVDTSLKTAGILMMYLLLVEFVLKLVNKKLDVNPLEELVSNFVKEDE